jgi:hypothetical protein
VNYHAKDNSIVHISNWTRGHSEEKIYISTDTHTSDKYGQKERYIYYYGLFKLENRKQEKEMMSEAIDSLLDEAKRLKDSEEWLALVSDTVDVDPSLFV